MNQSSSIDYSQNLINSIEEIELRKMGFIQGVIKAKKNELIENFRDKRRNLVQGIMDAKGHRHLQDNAIDEINKNFLDSFSNQVLYREDSFVYDSTTRNYRIVSKQPAYIAGSSSKELVSDFNIDDLSDVNKEIIKLYQDGMKENKMILKQSIDKLTTEKCSETIEAETEKLKKKFDNLCDGDLSIEEINEAETIFYNLYKFKKSDTDVYRATIEDEKEIVVDKNSKFYDALDMCYYHYLENGIGLGGRAPKAKDITRPDTVVPLDPKDMENAGPVEQQGAKGIKVESGSVQYLHPEPKHEPNKADKHEQLLKKSLAQVYKDTHEKASLFDRMYSGGQGKWTGIKNLVFHGGIANYFRYKKSKFKTTFFGSLFDFEEVDIEEPKFAKEVVDEEVVDEEIVAEEVVDEEVVDEEIVDEEVVDEEIVAEEVVDEEVVDEEIVDEEIVAEEVVDEEIVAEEVVDEEVVDEEIVAEEVVDEEVVDEEIVAEEVVDEEVVDEEVVAEEVIDEEVVDEKVATEKKLAEAEKKLAAAKLELAAANEQLAAANKELADANEQLAATKLELAAANKELAAANEQLVAKDEKLAAANEELAAKDEKLAAANKELAAANEELAAKDKELAAANEKLVAKDEKLAAANEKLVAKDKELAAANEQLLRSETRLSYHNAKQEKYKKYILQQIEEKNLDKKSLKQELENAGISYDEWIAYKKQQNSNVIMLKKHQIAYIKSIEDKKTQQKLMRKYGITRIELEAEEPMIQEEIDRERQAERKAKQAEKKKEQLARQEEQRKMEEERRRIEEEQHRIEEEQRKFEIARQQFIEKVASHYDDYQYQLILIGGLVNNPNPYGVTIDEVLAFQAEHGINGAPVYATSDIAPENKGRRK